MKVLNYLLKLLKAKDNYIALLEAEVSELMEHGRIVTSTWESSRYEEGKQAREEINEWQGKYDDHVKRELVSGAAVLTLDRRNTTVIICSDKVIDEPDFMQKFGGCDILFSGYTVSEKEGGGEVLEMPPTTLYLTKDSLSKIWLDDELNSLSSQE